MSFQNNSPVGLISAALIVGLSAIVCANLIKTGAQNSHDQFEFKQEGPVFLRFNKSKGDLCYTGIGPNGKFVTSSWMCMDGDKTKDAEIMTNSPFQSNNLEENTSNPVPSTTKKNTESSKTNTDKKKKANKNND